MNFFKAILFFSLLSSTVLKGQYSTKDVIEIKPEKNIILPKYNYGYRAFCDSLFSLYKNSKSDFHKDTGYTCSFQLIFHANSTPYSIKFTGGNKFLFKKMQAFLSKARSLNNWTSAYDLRTKKNLSNYPLSFYEYINTGSHVNNFSLRIENKTGRTLYKYSR